MNLMTAGEYCISAQEESEITTKRDSQIRVIENSCTDFNDAKRVVFDCLSLTIDALRGGSAVDVFNTSEATLFAILAAKASLDSLFAIVMQTHMDDY